MPRIWTHLSRDPFADVADARAFISEVQRQVDSGAAVAFAIVRNDDAAVLGTTRYFDIDRDARGLEIGHTWIGKPYWRTGVNAECKGLLLTHAFETLGAVRVQFKTDLRNLRSQRAIERLGAVREGVLRKNKRVRDGFIRDTVVYSILAEEWPRVRP